MSSPNPIANLLRFVQAPPGRVVRPAVCAEPGCLDDARDGAWCPRHLLVERDRARRRLLDRPEDQIPPHYREARFGTPMLRDRVAPAASDEARRAFEGGSLCVVLAGTTSTGKSTLAAALANLVRDAGREPDCAQAAVIRAVGLRWVTAMDLGKAHDENRLGDEPRILRAARDASVLVIDELGRQADEQHPTSRGRADAVLFRLLDWRHANNRQTILTTFLTPAQLRRDDANDPRALDDGGLMRRLIEPPHGRLVVLRRAAR